MTAAMTTYLVCAAVSVPFFAWWMYKNRSEAMGNSVLNCIVSSCMLAYAWPAAVLFMAIEKLSEPDEEENDREADSGSRSSEDR